MREVGRNGEQVTVEVSLDELRLMLGVLNESYNGAYAIPLDEWQPLTGQPPERAEALMDAVEKLL